MKTTLIIFISIFFSLSHTADEYTEFIKLHRTALNSEFKDIKTSPLPQEEIASFEKLDYYEINSNYNIEAELIVNDKPEEFGMKTTTARRPIYVKYGIAKFNLNGKEHRINIYRNVKFSREEEYKNHLFMLFTDNTSGTSSYGGGRYIDLQIPKGNEKLLIDFNLSYNPYCAYNKKYSCPIPSEEDYINTEIKAGVKKWH